MNNLFDSIAFVRNFFLVWAKGSSQIYKVWYDLIQMEDWNIRINVMVWSSDVTHNNVH
jgi:hypothetical protein